ncbi:MAG TPA: NCS1 family nucleobase:cation symporter-1, partial [Pseudonocardia sp.]
LAPVARRTWGVYDFFALWMQDIHSITVYTFAAALFFMGLNGWQVFVALTISVLVIWALMTLVGMAGQRTGVPFPVLARASFGIHGANVAALIRAGVAVIYYGVLTYLGSVSLQLAALRLIPSVRAWTLHSFLGLHALGWACFAVMWVIQLVVVRRGMEAVRRFQDWAGPAVWIVMLALGVWMVIKAGGHVSFDLSPHPAHGARLIYELLAAIALNVSFFATFLVNFADFSRHARSTRSVLWGNFLGLPVNFVVFAVVSVTVTSASIVVYGHAVTDPVKLVELTGDPWVIVLGAAVFVVATIGINVVADFISCAYDFSNLMPKHITFFRGGLIAAVLSVLPLPWHLYSNPDSIKYFVGGLGAFLGPLFGVLMTDYWLVKRTQIDVAALYDDRPSGRYFYRHGFNPRALVALLIATVISAVAALVPAFSVMGPFSWAIGVVLAAGIYLPLSGAERASRATSARNSAVPAAVTT